MIVKVGGCFGGELPGFHSSGFLVNGRLLFDAGTVTSAFSWGEQAAITDVFLTHAHLDHVQELAFLADNRAGRASRPFVVTSTAPVIGALRRHLFNDRIWPDFNRIPSRRAPVLRYRTIPAGRYANAAGLRIKPVAVSHTAPAVGYIIREPRAALLYTGDTGPTEAIWRAARRLPELKAAIVEVSFPNAMEDVAVRSGHLTPALLARELQRLGRSDLAVYGFHMKPLHLETIAEELRALPGPRVELLRQNRTYVIA